MRLMPAQTARPTPLPAAVAACARLLSSAAAG
jgi:hypothetical protein